MNIYSVALFLHIVGAVGFFVALGLEWTGLSQIRSAMTLEQARAGMAILRNVRKVGFVSMLTTVITGIYMMVTVWGGVAWLFVTLGSLVVVIALAQTITAPKMAAVGQSLTTEGGAFLETFHSLVYHPLLSISIQTRVAISLGIILLKIAKPALGLSLLAIGVAVVLGLASTLYMPRRERLQGSTD